MKTLAAAMRSAVVEWLQFNAGEVAVTQIAEIMLHRIEYHYKGGYGAMLLTDSDKEHIAYSITQGISEGVVCTTLDISEDESKEVYGYWKINNCPE